MSPLVSVCINNFNYAQFLKDAIDSALGQTCSAIEVVVVDDGSTDASREVIAGFGERIVPVLKQNGGQASAFNVGVAQCRGEIICFLDADDTFSPDKVARVADAFARVPAPGRPTLVHHPLTMAGAGAGRLAGHRIGRRHDSPLNLYDFAQRYGFLFYMAGPTSSLAINRALAERLFPIPEEGVRTSADDFIVMGASLLADLYCLDEPLGFYHIHGENTWFGNNGQKGEAFRRALDRYLNERLAANGLSPVMRFDKSAEAWPELLRDKRWGPLATEMLTLAASQHPQLRARAALRLALRQQAEASDLEQIANMGQSR